MALELETVEIPVATVGVEAAQQALDALGVDVDAANADAAASETPPHTPASQTPAPATEAPQERADDITLAPLLEEARRTNQLLSDILAALESRPVPTLPTY